MHVYECILSLITGVGVFILAMKLMTDSLTQIAGDRLKKLLEKLAGNEKRGVLIGALVTAIIQSSSATTVMVIGFVNADIMNLNQAAAIIIGSNIGTTITGILASLESLNISLYLSLFVFIGVILSFIKKLKKIANLLISLGMIFVGLKMMSNACDDKSIRKYFSHLLKKLEHPLLLELIGVIITAIIQSSSAMSGIVIVMVGKKVMTLRNGLFITLGANVGTCVTALISIIGANTNSKRTALIHFIFNMSGCILFTPLLWIFGKQIIFILKKISSDDRVRIAYFHLFFNITTALIMTPLIKYLVSFVTFAIKEEQTHNEDNDLFIKEKEGKINIKPSSVAIDVSVSNNYINEDLHINEYANENDELIKKNIQNKKEFENNYSSNKKYKEKTDIIIEINNNEEKKEEEKINEENLLKNSIEEEKAKLKE